MLFHVRIDVYIPPNMDPQHLKKLGEQEHERAKELQMSGKWVHLWRVAGKYANISIFDVESPTELHDLLNSLPLYPIYGARGGCAVSPSWIIGNQPIACFRQPRR